MTARALPPEVRLFLLAAGPSGNERQIAAILQHEKLDWRLLGALAAWDKATPILWRRIAPLVSTPPDDTGFAALRKHAHVADFRHSVLEQCFVDVIGLLHSHDIHPVLLKGAALALTVHGSFENRPMGDLDLLVGRESAGEAQERLLNAGWREEFPVQSAPGATDRRAEFYRTHHHLPALVDPMGASFALELHTDLFPQGNPFKLNGRWVRDRAADVEFRGFRLRVPNVIDQLIHLCLHFAWSHMMRSGGWRTFRDIQAIIDTKDIDWKQFVQEARENRGETCCYWTLRLAKDVAGVTVPEEVCVDLQPAIPAPVQRRLEYHLTRELLPLQSICPSVRLRKLMWSTAIQPGRSGHGAARPWHYEGHVPGADSNGMLAGSRKFWGHIRQFERWTGYIGAILAPPEAHRPALTPARRG